MDNAKMSCATVAALLRIAKAENAFEKEGI